MNRFLALFLTFLMIHPVLAEQEHSSGLPAYSEAVLPIGTELYSVAIGPGGPDKEFASNVRNGGLYKAGINGTYTKIELSDGQGLRNPTGIVEHNGQIVLVDGNEVISVTTDGTVNWRRKLEQEGVFFYDIEVLDDTTLLVSDFGRGVFIRVTPQSGDMHPYLEQIHIGGLARFEITEDIIYAVSWGADDAWNSALYQISVAGSHPVAEKLSDGFGNLESVAVIDGSVVVGGYRGHERLPTYKLMQLDADGDVYPLQAGANSKGVSDIYFDGRSVWLNYFLDAAYQKVPVEALFVKP